MYKDYTLREFSIHYEGWRELEDNRQRESWERARMVSYFSASANLKKGTRPKDLFRNPYETRAEIKGKTWTRKELDKRIKNLNKLKYREVTNPSQIR